MKLYKMNGVQRYKRYVIAELLPEHILENIFSYLDLCDLRNCAAVCRTWLTIIADENNDVWRTHCMRRLTEEVMKSDLLSTVRTYKRKLRAFHHAWNSHDCSRNIYIKPNGFTLHRDVNGLTNLEPYCVGRPPTFHPLTRDFFRVSVVLNMSGPGPSVCEMLVLFHHKRNPVAQSTDACRGKIGFRYGRHCWEIIWEGPLGTVAVIGLSTKEAPLQCQGYVGLLGSDQQSWGWNLVDSNLLHNGETHGYYPRLNNCPKYQVGERIKVILDCQNKTLSFERNFEFLGVAFRGLPNKKLYPTVSAVYGNTEVSMVYLGPPLDG